ncbi:MAG: primosomal protein N' [Clostridia bacterium]|nr:primosomal protein N' [Clostridia bacterium]
MFAEIIINSNAKALNKIFDYKIPKHLEEKARIGARVFVPFGRAKKLENGFIINLKEESEFANKDLVAIEEEDSLTENNIILAKLMARKYFCNISECIKLMLPPGTGSSEIDDRVKEKTGRFVYLNKTIEEIELLIENKKIKSENHIKVLKFLNENNGIYAPDLEAFLQITNSILKTLEKNGYIIFKEGKLVRNPFINKNIQKDEKKNLTEYQLKCFNGISKDVENQVFSRNLIFGVTGSGKTEVYLQLIEKTLNLGKTAIVLVPEISLTPQMVDRFLARFGENIAVLHSKLSVGERFDEWQKIKRKEAQIVIGARSAIFAPVENLGIIIIDEEHDMSYKSDMTPRYNSKDLAKYLASQNNCPLVLGSATPDLETYYESENNNIIRYDLPNRANNSELPEVELVDLRTELSEGNRSMISHRLNSLIQENLAKKKQTILFLNRRGYSTFVMCRDCGYIAKCKNCNISLTYHKYENKLRCHYCGFEQNSINYCPECNSDKVRYFGTGTQKLEEEVHKLFPTASTIRMDIDTVTKKNSHEEILNKFKNENIDILIGTQMVVKGHHFPNVTLVGVISVDGMLNIDDYRATERTFQSLVQVAGRAGREGDKGRVVIQSYNIDAYVINYAKKQDYLTFYNTEIDFRKMLKYPPFCDIILVRFQGENLVEIEKVSKNIFEFLKKSINQNIGTVYKPMPAPIDKIKNKHRWRMIIKAKLSGKLLDCINFAINNQKIKNGTSIIVDINPSSMM